MQLLRAFVLDHRRLAALLVALTLAMKALVPAGFMVDGGARTLTVHICTDSIAGGQLAQITIAQPGPGGDSHDAGHSAHPDSPCHFTALGHALTGGADPVQLVLALAFLLAVGFAAQLPASPRRIRHLRPLLRGPPATV